MMRRIYEVQGLLTGAAQPERRRQEAEAPFRAAIDFFRLDAERQPAPERAAGDPPVARRTRQQG